MFSFHHLKTSAADLIKQTGLAFSILILIFVSTRAAEGSENVTGFVYNDINFNQIMDQDEVGIANVRVVVTDSAGNQAETETEGDGSYTVEGLSGEKLKLEFYVPEDEMAYQPILGNNTLIQFATMDGAEDSIRLDAGFYSVTLFESTYVSLVTPCYVAGDPLLDGPDDWENLIVGDMEAVVSFPYESFGAPGDAQYIPPASLNTMRDVGTVWGLAYDRERFLLYQSAFLKRHSGLGELGLGGIYLTDVMDGNRTEPFVDLTELGVDVGTIGERDLGYVVGEQNRDAGVFPLVGKVGLGDIDISEDGTRLFAMNLFQKEVIELDTESASILNRYDIPDVACVAGEIRPFALKIDDQNQLWAGAVCSAENGGTRADLSAHVFRYETDAFIEVLSFNLDQFNRGIVNGSLDEGDWNPWNDSWTQNANSYTVPVLSDIEIDDSDGSLVLAFFDRTGHTTGQNQLHPESDDVFNLESGGDVLRACLVDGVYYIEGTPGLCDYNLTDAFPQGDEYYTGANKDPHYETGLGSLAILPKTGEVAATVYSPIFYSTAGITWLDNQDGSDRRDYQVYGADPIYFGKLNGLGDLEVINTPAPEILGSRIWLDNNENGLQDLDEPLLSGVQVELIDGTSAEVLATVTTGDEGQYLFSSGPGVNNQFSQFRVPLVGSKSYAIRIKADQSLYTQYDLTIPNVVDAEGDEWRNSDGETADGSFLIPVNLEQFSAVQTSLAFGMIERDEPASSADNDSTAEVEAEGAADDGEASSDEAVTESLEIPEVAESTNGDEIAAVPADASATDALCESCPASPSGRNPLLFVFLGLVGGLIIGVGLGGIAGINLQKRLTKQRDAAK